MSEHTTATAVAERTADPAAALTTPPHERTGRTRRVLMGVLGVFAVGVAWEAYKFIGPDDGVVVAGVRILPRTTDIAMPHLWDMAVRLTEPVTRAEGADLLWVATAKAAAFSLGVAALSWVIGVSVGLALALLMQRLRTAESAVLPWVVLSQTVPLIALAPLVRNWGSRLSVGPISWENWMSVAVIASYLAFFPVAVGALRGLKSPDAIHADLLRSYAASWWQTLIRLRLPASVPYLLPALRLAAANAVIGTVVAEVSIGLRGGIGRMILEFAQSAAGDPPKSWAPIFGAIVLGLLAAGAVALLGLALRRYRRGEEPA
ncbi:ABC transporter permease subunit [Occultella glacieicola]|uniref:ABC transporter permease subunit n=1 Tax=Occultella glacieicola TaxID=2518684 RepID=A0ABY2EAI2_9MICO|nr:ABC transporter permease subunit [Occultella glacieicola]